MSINATLLGQMFTFVVFVLFSLFVVWPMFVDSLEKRRKAIEDGLAAAENGHKTLQETTNICKKKISDTKIKCDEMVLNAKNESEIMLLEAVKKAMEERDLIINSGKKKLQKEVAQAKLDLQKSIGDLVILNTEKFLRRSLKEEDHISLLTEINDSFESFKVSSY